MTPKPNTPERDERTSNERLQEHIDFGTQQAAENPENIGVTELLSICKELQSRRTKDEHPSGPFTFGAVDYDGPYFRDSKGHMIEDEEVLAMLNARPEPVEGLQELKLLYTYWRANSLPLEETLHSVRKTLTALRVKLD